MQTSQPVALLDFLFPTLQGGPRHIEVFYITTRTFQTSC